MYPKRLLLLSAALLSGSLAFAQVSLTNLNLKPLHADVSAIDYDGDGDLDLLISGEDGGDRNIALYLNDGNGNLAQAPTVRPLVGVTRATFGWGDVNGDGKLDFIESGFLNDPIDSLFTSDGAGTFTKSGIALPQITPGCGFADLNNDGYTDIYVFGNKFQGQSKLLMNDRNGGFNTVSPFDSAQFIDTDVTPVDFDNDGDIDLFVTAGEDRGVRYSRMWVNDRGTFTERDLGLIAKGPGSSAWMDVDGNGWLDLLLNGDGWQGTTENSNEVYRLYLNNGGVLTADTTFEKYRQNSTGDGNRLADWDNDGDVDVIVTGWNPDASTQKTGIFLNDGAGNFTFWPGSDGLPGVSEGSIEVADFDNDSDLDLILTGFSGNDYNGAGSAFNDKIAVVVRNAATVVNAAPTAPTNLQAVFGTDSTVFTWDAATDATTPAASLSYNLFVVSDAGRWYYWPLADTATGKSKLPALGNVQLNRRWVVRNLPVGVYRWGVQAVDNSFSPSAFAKATLNSLTGTADRLTPAITLYPNPAQGEVSLQVEGLTGSDLHIEVSDLMGRRLLTRNVAVSDASNLQLASKGSLAPGQYQVKVTGKAFSLTRKLVIE